MTALDVFDEVARHPSFGVVRWTERDLVRRVLMIGGPTMRVEVSDQALVNAARGGAISERLIRAVTILGALEHLAQPRVFT